MSWGNFASIVLGRKKKTIPDGTAISCLKCQETIFSTEFKNDLYVCKACGCHHTMPATDRIESLLDEGSFKEIITGYKSVDPLGFTGKRPYKERMEEALEKTGLEEAVVCYKGKIDGRKVLLASADSRFLMGSMGSAVGEKLTLLFEEGTKRKLPVIIINCGGGGARMDEGIFSLMQMVKTCNALKDFQNSGSLYISVLTNPTMGGVMASFACLGDILLAEPEALIGFAGPRVIKQTIQTDLPEKFQESEFLLEHGHIDRIVARKKLKKELSRLIQLIQPDLTELAKVKK